MCIVYGFTLQFIEISHQASYGFIILVTRIIRNMKYP
jgi:hypothetical protein